jgi:hypothetical protein
MARPERFELPTLCFEGRCSIQLSYGRVRLFYFVFPSTYPLQFISSLPCREMTLPHHRFRPRDSASISASSGSGNRTVSVFRGRSYFMAAIPAIRLNPLSWLISKERYSPAVSLARSPSPDHVRIHKAMERAGAILGKVVRRMRLPEATISWLHSAWPDVVGRTLAGHTRPVRCKDGRLEISVEAGLWQSQLEGLSRDLISRVNQAWGATLVREISFVSRPTSQNRLPPELDPAHTPFIRRRRQ